MNSLKITCVIKNFCVKKLNMTDKIEYSNETNYPIAT